MNQVEFLRDLVLIFSWSALVVYFFDRLKIPAIVGFLVSGVALGPHGLSLVRELQTVETLAEIGVVLLLFTVGLEFSMTKVYRMRKMVLAGGAMQVGLTIAAVAGIGWFIFGDGAKAIFMGFLVALSSTAVVLKVLMDRAEISTMQGEAVTGILVFQDLCAVPMMLMIPFLAGSEAGGAHIVPLLLKALALVAAVLAFTRWVVPNLLFHTVNTRNRDLFMMVVLLMCLGTALITFEAGLSLALGAFLAGMMIADSEYSHQVVAEILPFRDIFNSLFFVSIGMLLNLKFAFDNLPLVLAVTAAIILIKAPLAALPSLWSGYPARMAIGAGLSLSQIGEFSFVLAKSGLDAGIAMGGMYQAFLAASVITMAATPFMMGWAPKAATVILKSLPRRRDSKVLAPKGEKYAPIRDHVIIVGFGLNGQNLARVLRSTGVPYNILELNPGTVREQMKLGEQIHYGDATREYVLRHVGVHKARVLVVAISDPAVERRVLSVARQVNPNLHIIVRTRYVKEIDQLAALGANEVIPEEFETSIEIFSHVLQVYDVPFNVIMEQVSAIRHGKYQMMRYLPGKDSSNPLSSLLSHKLGMQTVEVPPGAAVAGQMLSEIHLRGKTGATVLAVQRKSELTTNPSANFALAPGDLVYVVGAPGELRAASEMLKQTVPPEGGAA